MPNHSILIMHFQTFLSFYSSKCALISHNPNPWFLKSLICSKLIKICCPRPQWTQASRNNIFLLQMIQAFHLASHYFYSSVGGKGCESWNLISPFGLLIKSLSKIERKKLTDGSLKLIVCKSQYVASFSAKLWRAEGLIILLMEQDEEPYK